MDDTNNSSIEQSKYIIIIILYIIIIMYNLFIEVLYMGLMLADLEEIHEI